MALKAVQGIVYALDITVGICSQSDRVTQLMAQYHLVFPPKGIEGQLQGEATVGADNNGLRAGHSLTRFQNRCACILLFCIRMVIDHHWRKAVAIWLCFFGQVFHILFIAGDPLFQPGNLLWKPFEN